MDASSVDITRLRGEISAGRLSRHELLEEIERHLDRSPEAPVEGALELILEELHKSPDDTHLLRLLARLYERDGDPEGARRALEVTQRWEASDEMDEAPRSDELSGQAKSLRDRLLVARVLIQAGFVPAAYEVATRAVEAEPNSLAAFNLLAKICHIQGRLTDAIRLWHRIQMLSPHREAALAHLGFLHRLARDDEWVGKRFMAVGEGIFARKDQAQIELERAFGKFREQDFSGAIRVCEQLATGQRGKSPLIYKLAVLQKAWIQERMGNLEGARDTLEKLARERGYEMDLDRLGFLARICERLATPTSLEKALHIYEHLNIRHGKMSALPRLADLCAARGENDQAASYSREYERRFARRMQKPTPAEVLRALALQYIPLQRVPPVAFGDRDMAACELEVGLSRTVAGRRRRRALLAYLVGNRAKAQRLLARLANTRLTTAKDLAYLGDLLALRDHGQARRYYEQALTKGGASDIGIWRNYLGILRDGAPADLDALLSPEDRTLAHQALQEIAQSERTNVRAWQDLAAYEELVGMPKLATRHRAKSHALQNSSAHESMHIGRVLTAAVYSLNGKPKGIIHEILAGRRPATSDGRGTISDHDILGNVTADLRTHIRHVLAITLDYARATWPHLCSDAETYAYTIKVAKEDEPSSGTSAGLPIAVAFLSVLLQKAVPQRLAMTGGILCDAQEQIVARRVGDALFKVKGAYHRELQGIVLPAENREDIEHGDAVPQAVSQSMVRYAANLSEAVEILWGTEAWEW